MDIIVDKLVDSLEKKDQEKAPVMIGGSELTEKDLHCIAQHLKEFIQRDWREKSDIPCACEECQYFNNCSRPSNYIEGSVTNPWESFKKLFTGAGVKMSRWI